MKSELLKSEERYGDCSVVISYRGTLFLRLRLSPLTLETQTHIRQGEG